MRLFAALPMPSPAREAIAGVLDRLRAANLPVRWVRDEGLHLTLKFYGEVPAERREVIEESLRIAVRDTGPIPVRLTELGGFPSRRRPRILWIGLDAPPALELLQDRLERGGDLIGFPPEGRPFQPHVTLGRVREGHHLPPSLFDGELASVEAAPSLAEDVVLYDSTPGPGGARYTPLLTLPLTLSVMR
jgi:2'-5' RNA ligase